MGGSLKDMKRWSAWASVTLLAVLCAVVAILQYRWIGEISSAERQRLQDELRDELNSLRIAFSDEIANASAALQPDAEEVAALGRDGAYAARYERWKESRKPVFRRIALAVPHKGALEFSILDQASGRFVSAEWPHEWTSMKNRLTARLSGFPMPPIGLQPETLLETPRFSAIPGSVVHEQEWLLTEVNADYVRNTMLPELLARHLGSSGKLDFDVATVVNGSGEVLFESAAGAHGRIGQKPDASVMLLAGDVGSARRFPEPGRAPGGGRPFPGGPGRGPMHVFAEGSGWTLSVRHKAGSLEALVEHARIRNLLLSGGLLALIVATVATLVRFSRQAQRLAELQINFVAGVSHELRTPLTVIRTAAYNLRGRMASRPEHVERYGKLIQDESQKLDSIIEQVLRFASAEAGMAIRSKEPVQVNELIEKALRSAEAAAPHAGVEVEKEIAPGLPPVMADQLAMQHALQNLIDNALKYGAEGGNWIGISAAAVDDRKGPAVEIRVADRGPGIPADEQEHIFEPFFRGERAVRDQIHGTGLGLDLVKKIVVAHGGSIQVRSAAGRKTEFVLRIPAEARTA